MTECNRRTSEFGAIDIARILFAMLICAGHCRFLLDNKIVHYADSCGNPFFFVTSGFFLCYKMEGYYGSMNNLTRIKKYLRQMFRRYIVWTIIALPIIIWNFIDSKDSILINILWSVRDIFFRGEFGWSYMNTWFILSCIYTVAIVYLILKHCRSEKVLIFVIVFFALLRSIICKIPYEGITLAQAINDGTFLRYIFNITVGLHNSRLLFGLYTIPAGMLIAKKGFPDKYRSIPWLLIIPILVLPDHINYFSDLWAGMHSMFVGVLAFLCFYVIKLNSGYICRACRRASAIVYFTHKFFLFAFQKISGLELSDISKVEDYSMKAFLFSFIGSLLLGLIIHIMCEKRVCQKLTKLLL